MKELYKNGKKDGLWTERYKNGRKKEEKTYKDGEVYHKGVEVPELKKTLPPTKPKKIKPRSKPKKIKQGLEMGEKHIEYYSNGKMEEKGTYNKDGLKNGKWSYLHRDW